MEPQDIYYNKAEYVETVIVKEIETCNIIEMYQYLDLKRNITIIIEKYIEDHRNDLINLRCPSRVQISERDI